MPITYSPAVPVAANSALSSSIVDSAFSVVQVAYNNHTDNSHVADQHNDSFLVAQSLTAATAINNNVGTVFQRLDQFSRILAAIIDRTASGVGGWSTKGAAIVADSGISTYLDLVTITSRLSTLSVSASTASTWFKRDANGAGAVKALTIDDLAGLSASAMLSITGLSGRTGNLITASVNAVNKFTVSAAGDIVNAGNLTTSGNASVTGTFAVTSTTTLGTTTVGGLTGTTATFSAGVTAASFTGTVATSNISGLLPSNQVAGFAPSVSASTLAVDVSAGATIDLTGLGHFTASTTVTFVPPVSTNAYWFLVYVTPVGAVSQAHGAANPGSSAPDVLLDRTSGNYAVAWAYLPANAAGVLSLRSPGQAVAGGTTPSLYDARPANVASAISTGGTNVDSSARGADGIVTWAANPTPFTATLDIRAILNNSQTGTHNSVLFDVTAYTGNEGPNAIKTGSSDAPLSRMLQAAFTPAFEHSPASMITPSGANVTLSAGIGLDIAGKWCFNASGGAAVSAAGAGAAGLRYILADSSTTNSIGGNMFGLAVTVPTGDPFTGTMPALTATQVLIDTLLYDGANLITTQTMARNLGPFGFVTPGQIRLGTKAELIAELLSGGAQSINTVSPTAVTNASLAIRNTKSMNYLIGGTLIIVTPGASAGIINSQVYHSGTGDGGNNAPTPTVPITSFGTLTIPTGVVNGQYGITLPCTIANYGPGRHTIQIFAWNVGPWAMTVAGYSLWAIPFAP